MSRLNLVPSTLSDFSKFSLDKPLTTRYNTRMKDLEIMADLFDDYLQIQEEEAEMWEGFEAPELTEEDLDNWFQTEYSEEN
jgi:hypothetical protein